jgi:hypothetical protein
LKTLKLIQVGLIEECEQDPCSRELDLQKRLALHGRVSRGRRAVNVSQLEGLPRVNHCRDRIRSNARVNNLPRIPSPVPDRTFAIHVYFNHGHARACNRGRVHIRSSRRPLLPLDWVVDRIRNHRTFLLITAYAGLYSLSYIVFRVLWNF